MIVTRACIKNQYLCVIFLPRRYRRRFIWRWISYVFRLEKYLAWEMDIACAACVWEQRSVRGEHAKEWKMLKAFCIKFARKAAVSLPYIYLSHISECLHAYKTVYKIYTQNRTPTILRQHMSSIYTLYSKSIIKFSNSYSNSYTYFPKTNFCTCRACHAAVCIYFICMYYYYVIFPLYAREMGWVFARCMWQSGIILYDGGYHFLVLYFM